VNLKVQRILVALGPLSLILSLANLPVFSAERSFLQWAAGLSAPSTGDSTRVLQGDGTWVAQAGGGLPAGVVVMVASGACPSGYTEVSALNGKMPLGTLDANANVGGTGGADNITPSAHAATAVADHASHTHTYTEVPNHVHPYCSQTATTGGATSYEHGTLDTSSAETECTEVTNNPSGGVATGTTAGPSATLTHSVTQPSDHSAMDNRSAFVRVIFCEKQ
jgi:hypothetical protein